jgi:2-keto-4-pentenoate hydratase
MTAPDISQTSSAIAQAFSDARRQRRPLGSFPGQLPSSRAEAYAVQDGQIALSGSPVVGWKVAKTAPAFREAFGEERLAGPVFMPRLFTVDASGSVRIDIFDGGFAAVEAEFVAVMGEAPRHYDHMPGAEEAARHVASLHIGIEMAGSPLGSINELGPMAVVADCGNNDGVVLGPAIADWRTRSLESLMARVSIDGAEAGNGSAASVPGGPMAAVAFLIFHLQRRGLGLKVGDVVSTGAATGIHIVRRGQKVVVDFFRDGCINVVAS